MRQMLCVVVAGFVLSATLPLVSAGVSEPEDGDPDSDDQYDSESRNANQLPDEVVEPVDGGQIPSGPPIPGDPKLLQQSTLPWMAAKQAKEAKEAKAAKVAKQDDASNEAPAAGPNLPVAHSSSEAHHAAKAKDAAKVAKQAAVVANKVAAHSVKITGHAKSALKHALGALHDARVDSTDLGKHQKESLKKAEAHLREATKAADYGQLKKVKGAQDLKKDKMQQNLDKSQGMSEKEQMRHEIQELRKELKEKNIDDDDIDKALESLEANLGQSEGPVNDESKAELERLKQSVDSLEAVKVEENVPTDVETKAAPAVEVATPVQETGLDIDTQMPYGDLEPFGREDTAQELTESSIKESDAMVDQLERAEVSEEKRAVFRALTRLRGAAITSFDGVARSQTGNIDGFNKIHQWRKTHPLHHLADEESDVSKWAFPDNAD